MDFETARLQSKVHSLGSRTAEEWFELAMRLDASPETLSEAVHAYRQAIKGAPDWIEAHINLGTALFHLGLLQESRDAFWAGVQIDRRHALAHFDLGCVCDRLGDSAQALHEFRAALACAPEMAEAHLNLALVYEKLNRKGESKRHLSAYLHYDPQGRWAEFARGRLNSNGRARRRIAKVTPFRRARN
jgi:tetratricopeptide (TPR) repeat protein